MIDFRQLSVNDRQMLFEYFEKSSPRGCEMSFGNLFLWGDQKIAKINGNLVFLSTFSKSFYPFPYGSEDIKQTLETLKADASERGIDFILTAICEREKQLLESLYPNQFYFTTNDGSYDYVYDINDLADLPGKKYHKKRTHLRNFQKAHPNYHVEPFSKDNLEMVREMVKEWYVQKTQTTDEDFDYEIEVFKRAMDNYDALGLDGLVLIDDGEVLAVTFASKLSFDTLDVHFEKARAGVNGAYTAINYEFARYIRNKYPQIKFLDREEDMGLAGLRQAKQSYYPHHQVVKYKAIYKGDREIKAVVFDLDGTIADTEPLHKVARDNILVSFNLSPEELSDKAIGRGKREYWAEVIKSENLCANADELTVNEFKELLNIYKERGLKPQSGLVELLDYLKEKGVKLGVASSSDNFYVRQTLELLGIDGYFSAVVGSDDVGIAKPAPDVYLKAVKELGVLPENALAVEDSSTGAKAAFNAKMDCVGFSAPDALVEQDFSTCKYVVNSLLEIKKII